MKVRFLGMCVALLAAVATTGCCNKLFGSKEEATDKDRSAAAAAASPTPGGPKATALATQIPDKPTTLAPTTASDGYAPDGLPAEIPSARSKVPTLAEWNAVPREISVAKSTPLNCETKMVREWFRASCRKKERTKDGWGGNPLSISDESGKQPDTFTFQKPGDVISVVTPVLRGKRYSAVFAWDTRGARLVVDWPAGAPRPVIKFEDL